MHLTWCGLRVKQKGPTACLLGSLGFAAIQSEISLLTEKLPHDLFKFNHGAIVSEAAPVAGHARRAFKDDVRSDFKDEMGRDFKGV